MEVWRETERETITHWGEKKIILHQLGGFFFAGYEWTNLRGFFFFSGPGRILWEGGARDPAPLLSSCGSNEAMKTKGMHDNRASFPGEGWGGDLARP